MTFRTKLGLHVLRPTAELGRYVLEARPTTIKLVNDLSPGRALKAVSPGLITVGRLHTDKTFRERLAAANNSPVTAARQFVDEFADRFLVHADYIDYFEELNEESFGDWSDPSAQEWMARYGEFVVEFLRRLDTLGLRGCILNFSTGYPEVQRGKTALWDRLNEALLAAMQYRGAVGLHEYASPFAWWYTGDYQSGNCARALSPGSHFPGDNPQSEVYDAGYLTLRYRLVLRNVFRPRGIVLPIFINEFGFDRAGGGCPGMPAEAWRNLVSYWAGWNGQADPIGYWRDGGRDPQRYVAEQWRWYDAQMRADPEVVGAHIFTHATDNSRWNDWNIEGTEIVNHLIAFAQESDDMAAIPPAVKNYQHRATPIMLTPSRDHGARLGDHQAYLDDSLGGGWVSVQIVEGQHGVPGDRPGEVWLKIGDRSQSGGILFDPQHPDYPPALTPVRFGYVLDDRSDDPAKQAQRRIDTAGVPFPAWRAPTPTDPTPTDPYPVVYPAARSLKVLDVAPWELYDLAVRQDPNSAVSRNAVAGYIRQSRSIAPDVEWNLGVNWDLFSDFRNGAPFRFWWLVDPVFRAVASARLPLAMVMFDAIPAHCRAPLDGNADTIREECADLFREDVIAFFSRYKNLIRRVQFRNERYEPVSEYVKWLRRFRDAVRSVDAGIRVCASTPLSQRANQETTLAYARALLGEADAISIHLYADHDREPTLPIEQVQAVVAMGWRSVWVSEMGGPSLYVDGDAREKWQAIERLHRLRFQWTFPRLVGIQEVEVISWHRFAELPRNWGVGAGYAMVNAALYESNGQQDGFPYEVAHDAKAAFAVMGPLPPWSGETPNEPPPPVEEPAMPNQIINATFLEQDAAGNRLVVEPPWPGMSGRMLKPWRLIAVADHNTPRLNPIGVKGRDGVQDMPWRLSETIDQDAAQAPDIPGTGRRFKWFRGPFWQAMGQDVFFDTPGAYRLTTVVWPDSVLRYNPKTYSQYQPGHDDWYLGFEFRQGVVGQGRPPLSADAQFLTLLDLPPGAWHSPSETIVIPQPGVYTVFIEMRCRWALANAGGFIREVSLAPISAEPPPPGELPDISAELDAIETAARAQLALVEAAREKLRG